MLYLNIEEKRNAGAFGKALPELAVKLLSDQSRHEKWGCSSSCCTILPRERRGGSQLKISHIGLIRGAENGMRDQVAFDKAHTKCSVITFCPRLPAKKIFRVNVAVISEKKMASAPRRARPPHQPRIVSIGAQLLAAGSSNPLVDQRQDLDTPGGA